MELEHLTTFLDLIYSTPLNGEGHDKLCWKLARNKGFKVREYYFFLSSTLDTLFPWKLVWHSIIPPRVAFFSWTVTLGKILTLENLWYKGVAVVDWCYTCKKSGESVNHLLLHCFWVIVYGVGFVWSSMSYATKCYWFISWQGPFGRHQSIDLWRAVPHCVLWCIWQEQNSKCFMG